VHQLSEGVGAEVIISYFIKINHKIIEKQEKPPQEKEFSYFEINTFFVALIKLVHEYEYFQL
jgi:hypothetical protein